MFRVGRSRSKSLFLCMTLTHVTVENVPCTCSAALPSSDRLRSTLCQDSVQRSTGTAATFPAVCSLTIMQGSGDPLLSYSAMYAALHCQVPPLGADGARSGVLACRCCRGRACQACAEPVLHQRLWTTGYQEMLMRQAKASILGLLF